MNAHQLCGDSSEYGDIFESSQKCPQKLAFKVAYYSFIRVQKVYTRNGEI